MLQNVLKQNIFVDIQGKKEYLKKKSISNNEYNYNKIAHTLLWFHNSNVGQITRGYVGGLLNALRAPMPMRESRHRSSGL